MAGQQPVIEGQLTNEEKEAQHQEMLLEGRRILHNQKQRQDLRDDFEDREAENNFIKKVESGEEKIIPATDEEPIENTPLPGEVNATD